MRISDWSSDVCSSDLAALTDSSQGRNDPPCTLGCSGRVPPAAVTRSPPWHRIPPPSTTCLPHLPRNASLLPHTRSRRRYAATANRSTSARARPHPTPWLQLPTAPSCDHKEPTASKRVSESC